MKLLNKAGEMASLEGPDDKKTGTLDVGENERMNEPQRGYYSSMDPQRMGAVHPFHCGSGKQHYP